MHQRQDCAERKGWSCELNPVKAQTDPSAQGKQWLCKRLLLLEFGLFFYCLGLCEWEVSYNLLAFITEQTVCVFQ